MNREIKFKCFDKKTKTIRNVMSISFEKEEVMIEPIPSDGMYEFFKTGDIFTGGYVRKMVDVILMQFTDRYDTNGTPIYEYDILSNDNYKNNYKVKYMNGTLVLVEISNEELIHIIDVSHYFGINYFEIVGNIHDNPELLEGKE